MFNNNIRCIEIYDYEEQVFKKVGFNNNIRCIEINKVISSSNREG